MMPNLTTVNGGGLIKIAQAALKESKIVSSVTSLTNLDDANKVTFKDVLMSASLQNGRLGVKPFDVNLEIIRQLSPEAQDWINPLIIL